MADNQMKPFFAQVNRLRRAVLSVLGLALLAAAIAIFEKGVVTRAVDCRLQRLGQGSKDGFIAKRAVANGDVVVVAPWPLHTASAGSGPGPVAAPQ